MIFFAKITNWLRFHPVLRFFVVSVTILLAAVVVLTLLLLVALKQKEIIFPKVAEEYFKKEINIMSGEIDVGFQSVSMYLDANWTPAVNLLEVSLSKDNGPAFINFSRIDILFSAKDIIRGQLRPEKVSVDGVVVGVLRDSEGQFSVQFGDFNAVTKQKAGMFEALSYIDQMLQKSQFKNLSYFEIQSMTVEYLDERAKKSWLFDGARLSVDRNEMDFLLRADLALLTGGTDVSTFELNLNTKLGDLSGEFGLKFDDVLANEMASQSPTLAWLSVIDAPISGALRTKFDINQGLGDLDATIQIGQGVLKPDDITRPIAFESMQAYFGFDAETKTLHFDQLLIKSAELDGELTGFAQLSQTVDQNTTFIGRLQSKSLKTNPYGYFQQDLIINDAHIEFRLTPKPFKVEIAQIYASDNTRDVRVHGHATIATDQFGWSIAADLFSPNADREAILAYWPPIFKEKPRAWIEKNIKSANLQNIYTALRTHNGQKPTVAVGFDFKDSEFTFLSGFPSIKNASGRYESYDYRISTSINSGKLLAPKGGELDLSGSHFVIPNTRIIPNPAYVDLSIDGSINAVLATLTLPPVLLHEKTKIPLDIFDGHAKISSRLNFLIKPALAPNEFSYSVNGVLNDVSSTMLVPNHSLRAPKLDLEINENLMKISGKGLYDGLPFDGQFSTGLSTRIEQNRPTVVADVSIDAKTVDVLKIPLPSYLLSGQAKGVLKIDFPKEQVAEFSLRSDLNGAMLSLPALSWSKPKSTNAEFSVSGKFTQPVTADEINLSVADAQMVAAYSEDQGLTFQRFRLGNAMDVEGRIGKLGTISITGGTADLNKVLERLPNASRASEAVALSIRLDRLQITPDWFATDVKSELSATQTGGFEGRLMGSAPFQGSLRRVDGKQVVEITSHDAARFLMAAKAIKEGIGGKLTLKLFNSDTHIDGNLIVSDIKLFRLPALANILQAVSIIGLLEQMFGQGLLIQEGDVSFRVEDSAYTVERASFYGPSIGLTLDGFLYRDSNELDMQGVLSPIFALNSIGSVLTRKGEGLIGFNFNITGKPDNPQVAVNPLSVLTPGMFREIFRRPAPTLDD